MKKTLLYLSFLIISATACDTESPDLNSPETPVITFCIRDVQNVATISRSYIEGTKLPTTQQQPQSMVGIYALQTDTASMYQISLSNSSSEQLQPTLINNCHNILQDGILTANALPGTYPFGSGSALACYAYWPFVDSSEIIWTKETGLSIPVQIPDIRQSDGNADSDSLTDYLYTGKQLSAAYEGNLSLIFHHALARFNIVVRKRVQDSIKMEISDLTIHYAGIDTTKARMSLEDGSIRAYSGTVRQTSRSYHFNPAIRVSKDDEQFTIFDYLFFPSAVINGIDITLSDSRNSDSVTLSKNQDDLSGGIIMEAGVCNLLNLIYNSRDNVESNIRRTNIY